LRMKSTRWSIFLLAINLVASALLPGVQAASSTTLARGKMLYGKYCTFCHGKDGRGHTPMERVLQPPPRKFADPVEMARLTRDDIYLAIKAGRPGTAMPAWGRLLDESGIRDVTRYVQSLKQPLPPGMTQTDFDIRVGERIYRQYCVVCHGGKGKGQTTIGLSLHRPPQNFTDVVGMARLSNRELTDAIKNGKPDTAMVAWESILNDEDIRRIILFIRQIHLQ